LTSRWCRPDEVRILASQHVPVITSRGRR
jgi:hypothetical protein